jgi:hypothetical protein
VRFEQPRYVVALKKAPNAQQAIEDAQKLQTDFPAARAMRSDRGYFVVLDNPPAGETDALLVARQAKKLSHQVEPSLLEVK